MSRQPKSDDPIEILLVEDNPGDVRLVEEAFSTTRSAIELHTVTDGYEATYYLRRRIGRTPPSLPDLALVDLNVPGKDGCELLETIRGDPRLRRLPVIVLTSSSDSEDVRRCYDAYANAYVTKPADPDEFVALVESIERFWFDRVQLPPAHQ